MPIATIHFTKFISPPAPHPILQLSHTVMPTGTGVASYITNIGKVRAAFGAFIDPKSGNRYVIDTHFLEPGETTMIDYRSLRDQQVPDRNGLTLPKDAQFGEVQWFPLFFNGSQYLSAALRCSTAQPV